MPIKQTTVDGNPAWQYGDTGKPYGFTKGDDASSLAAKKKAIKQALAIHGGKFVAKADSIISPPATDPVAIDNLDMTSTDYSDQPCVTIEIDGVCIDLYLPMDDMEDPTDQLDQAEAVNPVDAAALKMMGYEVVEKEAPVEVDIEVVGRDDTRRLIYGVVLEPDSIDSQDQVMKAEDIEFAAHHFMSVKGIMGYRHRRTVDAVPVESYVAPVDFKLGDELVKKGSWVMVSKCMDDKTWAQVVSGEITGYSVGGFGRLSPVAPAK